MREEGTLDTISSSFDILQKKFPGYEDRPQQREMAREILDSFTEHGNLLIEAGTGVGKSFAYLIPAMLSGEKTIVSTSSLALQDQLVKKDLVFLNKALPQKVAFGILKGKNNYVCLKREREYAGSGKSYIRFRKWLSETGTGEKSDISFTPKFWPEVCGDSQDCGGQNCPFYGRCFYYKHYRTLYAKDILVVNHHLLVYDLLSDFSLLPFHRQLIIDEAPDIEDVISTVLGSALTYSRTAWLLYRLRGLKVITDHLFPLVESFFKKSDVPPWAVCPVPVALTERLKQLREGLALDTTVSALEERKKNTVDEELRDRIETTVGYIRSFEADMDDFIRQGEGDKVYYAEKTKGGVELKSSLVESGIAFEHLTRGYRSVIMTSATLTSGENFSFLKNRLHIEDFGERIIGSPFDFRTQALLYIDRDLPKPDTENGGPFEKESLKVIERLIEASRGRALVLFTSYRNLDFVAENLETPYPCKRQGEMPPAKLIKWFRDTPGSVLLATATFWQGIDIKGDDLSLVIIVRLPFSSPGDPVYQERCNRLGGRWFHDLALPHATLSLRQGFGRLIRGRDEYGVVAILDTRLVRSSYGRYIVSSLPPAGITHDIGDVEAFFTAHE
ncbi:MAG TPA: helicase C-terminal domain-containing protein [Syntrophales bacterium]|nr:helicase C-terminal domain-containing protein [Syntrophales bacterium]